MSRIALDSRKIGAEPTLFEQLESSDSPGKRPFEDPAAANNKDVPLHRWVPWIAGFSGRFVKGAIENYLRRSEGVVLDPFAGVGTSLVEAVMAGHKAIGFEINPYAALACRMKLKAFNVNASAFLEAKSQFERFYKEKTHSQYVPKSSPPEGFRTRGIFYSPSVLKKVLIVQDFIRTIAETDIVDLFRLAFASTMITYSNYSYEPSLGQRKSVGKDDFEDFAVGETVLNKLEYMAQDIELVQSRFGSKVPESSIWQDSFLNSKGKVAAGTVDLMVTSPPYLNNYHYNRNTRPHLYWLGYVQRPQDMKVLEEENFGKFWQTVRDRERIDLQFRLTDTDLHEQLELLRSLNQDRGVYGGQGWANYAASYFNDCRTFTKIAKHVLRRKGVALVVIGNSLLQGVMIPTDRYLGEIAESVGLELVDIHIPRLTRVGSSIIQSSVRVGKAKDSHQLYEAVVELRKK